MSMFEIGLMVKELRYDGIVLYHYELPNSSSVEKLISDEDVMKMCECVPRVREIDIFLTQLADDPYTFLNKHKQIELQRVEGSGVQKQRSVVIEDLGYADCSPLVPYKTKNNVEQPTKYPKPYKVKIVEQEVNDVGDFSEPKAPKKGKGKTVGMSSKGKEVAEPEVPKRARATKSSKGKGMWITNHAPVEDTFRPLQDEEINKGEGVVVNKGEGGVRNYDNLASGDQPSQAGLSGDHPSQTSQNEDQPSQTGQNRDKPSQTTDFHYTDLQDTILELEDQAVKDELRSVHSYEGDETVAGGKIQTL
ncbi:unnamed protein product [Prunus armeniaca]|uniref:Uncharacterized protein n=1 Tax=Prunus armeniaca TaxID=36596 RepID=A0A6J5VYQ0_PRUAR|nr:unnamed protein product [Prunus armeniaca]CAB4294369.1 unnamed protein product [Prunus armeniaca]